MSYLIRSFLPAGLRALLKVAKAKPHQLVEGFGIRSQVGEYCKNHAYNSVLIVTDANLRKLGLLDKITESLEENNIKYNIFDEILPNPTFSMVEKGTAAGLRQGAKCIIAVGGGSVMDTAKVVSGAVKSPKSSAKRMATSYTTVLNDAVPMITIPTTAGTGAETTLGVVISNDETHVKYVGIILYTRIEMVMLDSELTLKCPPAVTASTGFDALSHGIEGYLADISLKGEERLCSLECTQLALKYLPIVYKDGSNIEARQAMAKAAYLGGITINKETLGYGHSFGHTIGAKYGIAHGESLSITLPAIMRFQKEVNRERLAELAVACEIGEKGDSTAVLADKFIDRVVALIDELGLPTAVPELKEEDYPELIANVFRDSQTWLVKRVMTYRQAEEILDELSGNVLNVSEDSEAAEIMSGKELALRLGILGAAAAYGIKKKNFAPLAAVVGFHGVEYLAEKQANKK